MSRGKRPVRFFCVAFPAGTRAVSRPLIIGAGPQSEMDSTIGRHRRSSGVSLPKDGRLEFNLRWYNSDVSFDGFADSGAPADVFGAKQTTRNLIISGSYEQPITSWWSQKLTLAQANERNLGTSGNVGRNLNTGRLSRAVLLPASPISTPVLRRSRSILRFSIAGWNGNTMFKSGNHFF